MAKTIIFIRHGPDKRTSHKYDEKLTSEGKEEVKEFTWELLKNYGCPEIIYYSPFYRTRQTRKAMLKIINQYKKEYDIEQKVELVLEPRLGRFFTKRQRRNPDIKSSTYNKGAIIDETKDEFKKRIEEHLDDILENSYSNIWNITHTLIILNIAKIRGIERDSHVKYLDTLKIES